MKRWMGAVTAVVLTSLACGGMGAEEVHRAVMAGCATDVIVPPGLELVRIDQTLPPPKLAVTVQLGEDRWTLDGALLEPDPDQLSERLREKAETAKALAARAGSDDFAFRGELLLLVPPDTRGQMVLTVLEAAHAAAFAEARFVVVTGDKPEPTYLDPTYGAELQTRLDALPPEERAMTAAMELEGLLVACPPGQRAFEAVASASAEMKCDLMAYGLADALPMCPLTNDKKVVTVMQVMSRTTPYEHGVLRLSLDPEGTPHEVDPTAPWSTLAPWWAGQDTKAPAWWVAAD